MPVRDFIAEQYIPSSGAETATAGAAAARQAAEETTREGMPVHYVRSIFVPDDETCIHFYRADSIEAVRAAAARASLPLERLTEAISNSGRERSAILEQQNEGGFE